MTVCFLVILISSVIGFFLTLSSAFISTACLIISFLSVLGIRIGLGKMDEFKSLYVNTVPMINPEKDFKEGRSLAENEELMLSKGVSADEVEAALEALVEEGQQLTQIEEIVVMNDSSQTEDVEVTELEEIQEETEATELEETQEETEVTEVEETQEETEAEKLDDVQEESAQQTLSLEEQVFETIKMILTINHCEVENLSFKTVGKYLTIYLKSRVMMRLKLTGRPLGELYPSPGYCGEIIWLYAAKGLHEGKTDLDEDEFLEAEKFPLKTAVDMILNGEIKDAKTQAAVLKVAELKRRGKI